MNQIKSIGFIMDGNRRWAKEQGLPTYEGHRKGGDVLQTAVDFLRDVTIPHAVFYAFSTENWKRSEEEVEYLMDLFREWLSEIENKIDSSSQDSPEKTTRVRVIGRRDDFPEDIISQMNKLEKKNAEVTEPALTVWLALSYGGRAEIVDAVNQAIEKGEKISEAMFGQLLWTADMPDPDMIVRTSGEQRLSNFVTWRSVYSLSLIHI